MYRFFLFFFFKQKTAYEMRISDWSSDVCSSDLNAVGIDNAFACQLGDRVFKTIDAVDPDQLAQLFGTECAWAARPYHIGVPKLSLLPSRGVVHENDDISALGEQLKNGRESCREMVGQYV